jgi:crotonobetainyl-CoA:carnitine CoA-transferase CaiB-like acyl-CoA transferase
VQSSAFELSLRRPAPGLGEHTREVLEEPGLTSAEIEALATAGAISLGGGCTRE